MPSCAISCEPAQRSAVDDGGCTDLFGIGSSIVLGLEIGDEYPRKQGQPANRTQSLSGTNQLDESSCVFDSPGCHPGHRRGRRSLGGDDRAATPPGGSRGAGPRCPPARRRPPRRLVFYQPALTCTRCHVSEGAGAATPLGPDLAAMGKNVPDAELVESILEPSKVIKKGYETGHDRHGRRPDDHRPAGRGAARRGRPPRPRPGRQAGHDRQGAGSNSGATAGRR